MSGAHRLEVVTEALHHREAPGSRGLRGPDGRGARDGRVMLRAVEAPGRTPPAPALGDIVPTDLGAPELYLNRELTYLNFCWRVLHEAEDERVPLLERVKFIGIVSSNIDEFFQKRIGGLKQQVGAPLHKATPEDRKSTRLNSSH